MKDKKPTTENSPQLSEVYSMIQNFQDQLNQVQVDQYQKKLMENEDYWKAEVVNQLAHLRIEQSNLQELLQKLGKVLTANFENLAEVLNQSDSKEPTQEEESDEDEEEEEVEEQKPVKKIPQKQPIEEKEDFGDDPDLLD